MLDNNLKLKMDKLFTLIAAKIFSWFLYPTAGFTSYFSYLQFSDKQIFGGIVWGIGTIVAIIIASYVKLKLGSKELTITANKNESDASIVLVKIMQEETARSLKEEKEFWVNRLSIVRKDMAEECEREKIFWVTREEKVRIEKHDLANDCNRLTLKYESILLQLKDKGVSVTEKAELIWPEKLKILRKEDTKNA